MSASISSIRNVAQGIVGPMPNRLIYDATLATVQRTVVSLEEQCGGPGRVSLPYRHHHHQSGSQVPGSDQNEVATCNRFSEDSRPQQPRFHLIRGQCPNAINAPPLPGFLRTRQSIFALGFCKPSEQRSEHSIELAGLPEGATPVAAQQAAALHALLVTEEHQRRCQTCLNHYFCGEWQGYHPVPTSCSPELAGSRPPTGRFFTGSSQFTVVCLEDQFTVHPS